NTELLTNQQKEVVQKAFTGLDDDPEAFATLMTRSRGEGFGDKPMLNFVGSQDFVSMIESAAPRTRHRLCFAVRDRYNDNQNVNALSADLDWLRDVLNGLGAVINGSEKKTPGFYWL